MSDSPEQDRPDRTRGGDPDLAGYLQKESPRRAAEPDALHRLPTPDDPPPPAGSDMRDMEKSLVERIADVDDDRRRNAVQLRKALETHREEIRGQRRRDHTAILVLAGIGIILLAALLLLFSELFRTRDAMSTRIAAVEQAQQLETAPGTAAADMQADMDQLGDAIEAIADRLGALEDAALQQAATAPDRNTDTGPTPAAEPAPDPASQPAHDEGLALDARLSALLEERLTSLQARIDELRATHQPLRDDRAAGSGAEAVSDAEREVAPPAVSALSTDRDMVVLQLAGLPSRAAVERFIARHELPEQVYLKVDNLRGRSWYGLISGLYPDMAAAEAARDALAPDLARLDIWLRELPAGTPLEVLSGED